MQDNLNNLHGVVLHILYLALRALEGLLPLVLPLSNGGVAILKLVFLEIVVQVAEHLLTGVGEVLESWGLIYRCEDL